MKKPESRTGTFRLFAVATAVLAMLVAMLPAYAGEKKPLKVIILVGQSNMQEPASWTTLKGLADSQETKPLYDKLVDKDGKVLIHTNVYVVKPSDTTDEKGNTVKGFASGLLPLGFAGKTLAKTGEAPDEGAKKSKKGRKGGDGGGSFGPELGFGVTLNEKLNEPILLIKTAWGGKSLYHDFRPPTETLWTPPKGHPDHPDTPSTLPPLPTSFMLPEDFEPPTGRGKNMQILSGQECVEIKGIHPIYVFSGYGTRGAVTNIPFQKGDLILGLNGKGLGPNPVLQWRGLWFTDTRKGDWKLRITWWRPNPELGPGKGTIKTTEFDTAQMLENGQDDVAKYLAEEKAEQEALLKGGEYYWKMIKAIKTVLKDPGKYCPAYDPKQGYQIAGFVWFHGYNDIISSTAYPNGDKPRGYEQYSWLLAHLIRNVRKELDVPKMPVVVGVFGQGGNSDKSVHFREAQAAVAGYEEFKGTVVAVQTVPFVDTRNNEIQNKLKNVMAYRGDDPNHPYAKLQAEVKAYREKMENSEEFKNAPDKKKGGLQRAIDDGIINIVRTKEEQEYLRNNVSNKGYHYDGSPKFFVRAGEAFGKAMYDLVKAGK